MPDDRPPPPDPDRSRVIDEQLRRLAADRRALLDDRDRRLAALAAEEQRLLAARAESTRRTAGATDRVALPPPPASLAHLPPPPGVAPVSGTLPPPPRPAASEGEWRPLALRTTLLAVGAVLLGLAALVFAVVAWPRLGGAGRAGLLAGTTLAVGVLTVAAVRRLPATAEALGGVLLALLVVDWLALRRAGVGADVALDVWWVVGLTSIGAIGVALGAGLGLAVGRQAGPLLVGLGLGLALTVPRSAVTVAVGASVVAGLVVVAGARLRAVPPWGDAAVVVTIVGWLLWVEGLVATGIVAADRGAGPVTGAVLATLVIVPLATRWARRATLDPTWGVLLVAASVGVVLVAALVAVADVVSGPWLTTVAVAAGAVAVTSARLGPPWLRSGSALAGIVIGGLALVEVASVALAAGTSAWLLLAEPWTVGAAEVFVTAVPTAGPSGTIDYRTLGGTTAAGVGALVLAATALAAGLDHLPGRRLVAHEPGTAVAVGATGAGVVLVVVGAGASYGVLAVLGVLVALAMAHVLVRTCRSPWWTVLALLALVASGGWALAGAGLTLGVVLLTAALAAGSAVVQPRLRPAFTAVAVSALLAVGPAVVLTVEEGRATPALPLVVLTLSVGASACLVLAAAVRSWRREQRLVVAGPALVALGSALVAMPPAWSEQRWPVAVALGVAALAAIAGAGRAPSRPVAQVAGSSFAPLAAASGALGVLAGGWSPQVGAAMAVLVAAVILAVTPHVVALRPRPVVAAGAGVVAGIVLVALGVDSVPWPGDGAHALAVGLTLTAAGSAIAGLAPGWRRLEWVALAVAVAGGWSWLGVAGVGLVEAYTVPTAVVVLGTGLLQRRRDPSLTSWIAYGPGLVVGLLPSLVLALGGDGPRAVGVALVCLGALVVGTGARLQAPVALGAAGLVAIGVHTVAPVAAQVPRWAVLAVAGAVSLWLGATVERRLGQARGWARRFGDLA